MESFLFEIFAKIYHHFTSRLVCWPSISNQFHTYFIMCYPPPPIWQTNQRMVSHGAVLVCVSVCLHNFGCSSCLSIKIDGNVSCMQTVDQLSQQIFVHLLKQQHQQQLTISTNKADPSCRRPLAPLIRLIVLSERTFSSSSPVSSLYTC